MDFSKLPAILTPDLGLLFWMLLAFAVVFFVLAKYGFPWWRNARSTLTKVF